MPSSRVVPRRFADAPVARTRQAAQDGTLSSWSAAPRMLSRASSRCCAAAPARSPIAARRAAAVVKILNNMILFPTGIALAEAMAIARPTASTGKVLFATFAKGSADSFALRNHGIKAMLPGIFPERAFSSNMRWKDLCYALHIAEVRGVTALGADVVRELMERAAELGHGKEYWPVLLKAIEDATKK